ncbi:MAG TPA: D-glutamate deacylase, partial [Candidatus Angelobacter sp.]|nr:D-glutamate deacylase [Candidatus Angelobacter sp.]
MGQLLQRAFSGSAAVLATFAILLVAHARPATSAAPLYDTVILNGRVMDPQSGFDAVRNVGISNGKIVAITTSEVRGKQTIAAKGLVVGPGFIDLHEHGQEPV